MWTLWIKVFLVDILVLLFHIFVVFKFYVSVSEREDMIENSISTCKKLTWHSCLYTVVVNPHRLLFCCLVCMFFYRPRLYFSRLLCGYSQLQYSTFRSVFLIWSRFPTQPCIEFTENGLKRETRCWTVFQLWRWWQSASPLFYLLQLNQWKQPESQTQSSDRNRDQSWTSLSFGSEMSLSEVEMIK